MIPYFEWRVIELGPLTLQVWGLFVGLGFVLGAVMAGWLMKRRGQDPKIVYDILPRLLVAGMVGGRLGHVLFYDLPYFLDHPLDAFAIWEGGSSMFGGLIACVLVGLWYLRRRNVDIFAYADSLVFGLPFGIWLGRIGCFLIHDHPGTATDFFLGVKFPDGVTRHDLGLYESLAGLMLAVVFLLMARQPRLTGVYLALFSISYGLFRFVLDFYRTLDTRYFGLTPAQYLSIGLVLGGLVLVVWIRKGLKKA
jgi:phosphatidylglycerol---prolipoprotein diacylglyceryl transferase